MNKSAEIEYFIFSTSVEEFIRLKTNLIAEKQRELMSFGGNKSNVVEGPKPETKRGTRKDILQAIEEGNGLTNTQIADKLGITRKSASDNTYRLEDAGRIRSTGQGRGKKYYSVKK